MNVIILDLKFMKVDLRPGKTVQARVFDIHDAPAIQADKVVMPAELGIEARRRARVTDPGHEAKGNEIAQDAMDRHAGNLGQLAADLAIELFSRRMVAVVQDRLIDCVALGSNRQTAIAMSGEKTINLLFPVGGTHTLYRYANQMIKICK